MMTPPSKCWNSDPANAICDAIFSYFMSTVLIRHQASKILRNCRQLVTVFHRRCFIAVLKKVNVIDKVHVES